MEKSKLLEEGGGGGRGGKLGINRTEEMKRIMGEGAVKSGGVMRVSEPMKL